MKKVFFLIFFSTTAIGQVSKQKIGTNPLTIHASAALEIESASFGFLPPRMTDEQMGAIVNPAEGLVVYSTTSNCLKYYANGAWSDCLSTGNTSASVAANCNLGGFQGSYAKGIALTGSHVYTVSLTNNTFSSVTIALSPSDLVLSGISGLTVSGVSLNTVTLASGETQQLSYSISGTPTSSGTLVGTWTKLALQCVKSVAVLESPVASIDCAGSTHTGTLTEQVLASGVSTSVAYSGGNGTSYATQSISSTGITGLTATLDAGTFATGNGVLTYAISGTPSGVGTASFTIQVGGLSCTFTRSVVSAFTIPPTIFIGQNQSYLIASTFDQDYLPFSVPTGAATTTSVAADGVSEAAIVNIQGTITTTGTSVKIPYVATGAGTMPAYTNTITIPAELTQDGISRDVTLSWSSQSYTSGNGYLNATIAAVGGVLNIIKLDINAGNGVDFLGVLVGSFVFPYINSGSTTTFQIRAVAGIPDKMYGIADNSGSTTSHMMLYLPVVAEDGKMWLSNNLGAHYANIMHPNFNPGQQATSSTDYLAYGSLFQWGRKADGHELINFTDSATGVAVHGALTDALTDTPPSHASFITSTVFPNDWRINQDNSLWALESSSANPCPSGFRLPTVAEQTNLVSAAQINNEETAATSVLKITRPGLRHILDAEIHNTTFYGYYWSSEVSGVYANLRPFSFEGTGTLTVNRAYGFSVRCIKN